MNAQKAIVGFTIIELVVVIVLLGVLAATALPRLNGGSDLKAASHRDEVLSVLRYAQKSAVSHRRLVCAKLESNGELSLRIAQNASDTSCATDYPGPTGSLPAVKAPDVSITRTSTRDTFHFQASGQVLTAANAALGTQTIQYQHDSANLRAIIVEGDTGYVGSGS